MPSPFFAMAAGPASGRFLRPSAPVVVRSPVSSAALEYSPGHLCGECRERRPAFDSARAAGYYQGVLAEAIRLFKYQAKTKLSRHLAAECAKKSIHRAGIYKNRLISYCRRR